jgi:hypothetical protein
MWSLDNRTPYAAERNWTRDVDGHHHWLVALRATFDVDPVGRLSRADEQPAPVLEPHYFDAPGQSSLRYDSDLLDIKPTTDVLVIGSAHAPHGQPTPTVAVALHVGRMMKELLVHGNRYYTESALGGLSLTQPAPFVQQPIRYELAFGGRDVTSPDPSEHRLDQRNPIGRGFPGTAAWVDQAAHCIEYPTGNPAQRGPAGFGPIDRSWLPRRLLAGTYDGTWASVRRPLLPEDYDPAYGLSAPSDQRPHAPLHGGEAITLLNLTPNGRLSFELPRWAPRFVTSFRRKRSEHGGRLVSVTIEPDERRVSMVWQGALPVPAPEVDELDVTEIMEQTL